MRTNRVNYVRQVTELERIESNLGFIAEKRGEVRVEKPVHPVDDDLRDIKSRYCMGERGVVVEINVWLTSHDKDPAIQVRDKLL